jgi:predicted transcriptional regulator
MTKKLLPINIRVDYQLKEDLRAIAAEEDRPMANMIVRVLREYVEARKAGLDKARK